MQGVDYTPGLHADGVHRGAIAHAHLPVEASLYFDGPLPRFVRRRVQAGADVGLALYEDSGGVDVESSKQHPLHPLLRVRRPLIELLPRGVEPSNGPASSRSPRPPTLSS